MKLRLEMNCDNEYFEDATGERVATLLHGVADKIDAGERRVVIFDGNGNRVGTAEFVE